MARTKKVRWVWVEKEVKRQEDRVLVVGLAEGITPILPPRSHILSRKADAGVMVVGYWEQQDLPPKEKPARVE